MTGPKELALFTAAAAIVLLSGAASGQRFRGGDDYQWRPDLVEEAVLLPAWAAHQLAVDTGICPLSHLTP